MTGQVAAASKVSKRTVARIAIREGARYLSTTRAPPLTEAHKRQRLRFARRHLREKMDWKLVHPQTHSTQSKRNVAPVAERSEWCMCVCMRVCECVSVCVCVVCVVCECVCFCEGRLFGRIDDPAVGWPAQNVDKRRTGRAHRRLLRPQAAVLGRLGADKVFGTRPSRQGERQGVPRYPSASPPAVDEATPNA